MQNIKKPVSLLVEDLGWYETITDQHGSNIEVISIKKLTKDMEPKIKSPKELKIKAVESEAAIENAENPIVYKNRRVIPKTNAQKIRRAANKRAKKARKINRK